MVRRRFVLVFTLITAVVGGMPSVGWSQTTSSSSSTSSTSSSSTTSSTTTTTLPDPCVTTGGCPASPPAGFLRAAAGERPGVRGGYCWRQPPGSAPPGLTLCTSVLLTEPFPYERLTVRPGEQLTLRFQPALGVEGVSISRAPGLVDNPVQTFDTAAASPTTFTAEFPQGDHYITALVRFSQGAVPYIFAITVRATTTPGPTPGPVSFTG